MCMWLINQHYNCEQFNLLLKPKFNYVDFVTWTLSRTQIMKYYNTNYVTDFHDLCPPTFPVHCNGLNFITATQTGLSRTCHRLCHKHLDMSRWYVFATFVICVRQLSPKLHEFMICHRLRPRLSLQGSSVKVGIIEFGLRVFSFGCAAHCKDGKDARSILLSRVKTAALVRLPMSWISARPLLAVARKYAANSLCMACVVMFT